ncbi:hypothetical protein [Streptomyces sp. NBC_01518]|uniref:hypothetical protein n=1 Tax=Streptomyces sp. NBC_01518 TaxID=2903891 RepID=UPI00386D5623
MARDRDELSVLLKRLAHAQRVYVRSGRLPSTSGGTSDGTNGVLAAIAAETHILVGQLHREDWQRFASAPEGPAAVDQVEEALEPIAAKNAAALMGRLASQCLVWPQFTFMDRAEADAVAGLVVELLGADALWWANCDGDDEDSWTAVTACTFDNLVAGTDGHRFAVLIQVGED